MNPLNCLKTLLPLPAACGALLASLVVAIPSARAGTAAYFPAAQILPPADYTSENRLSAVAVNLQGYVLLRDASYQGDKRVLVYKNGQLLTLAGIDTVGQPLPTALSDTAADGSFNVVGEADFADGFHRVIYWHVNADGTSSAQMMQNRILPENSQQPGEQHSASAVAVNSASKIAGDVQSYLAGLGAFWYPPDIMPHSDDFTVYEGPTDMDEGGNFCGEYSANATLVAEYNHNDLILPSNIDSRATILRNGMILGEYVTPAPDYKQVKFVYNVAASTFQPLPSLIAGDSITTTALGYHGEAAGYASSGGLGGNVEIWLPDASTGAYSVTNLQTDILAPMYPSNEISAVRYGTQVVGFAGDGSMVVNGLTNSYYGYGEQFILILKPGADPRPTIIAPDPTYPTEALLHTKPGQAFSYQFTATNNPTAFRLIDGSDSTKEATLPGSLSFNKTTGVLSGTGPAIGSIYFFVEATNGQGIGAHRFFASVTSGDSPVITSASTATAHLNQPFSFQVTATNDPTNFQFTGLPDGVFYDSSNGLISGTPTKAGVFPVAETVDNEVSGGFSSTPSGKGTLTITVDDKPPAAFTVSLTKPFDGDSVIAGTAIKAKAKVDLTDAGTETVASLNFQLDGKPVGATLTAKPYKANLPLDGSLSGEHTLTVVATANDGRTAVSEPLTLNVAARFVDLAGSATLKPKTGADGKITIKGQYTLSNLGNSPAGSFRVGFYLSSDAAFDSNDVSLSVLATPLLGKDPGFDLTIPGLPANTTISSSDVGTLLPKLKLNFPSTLLPLLTRYSGKYILGVIDPENTAGEAASTRANNVIVYRIP